MKYLFHNYPELSKTWFDIANVCTIIGHYDTAIQAYRNALAINATCFDALYGIGQIALIRNDTNLLREIIEKFRNYESERFRYCVLYGQYYLKINDIKKSYECFKEAGNYLILDNFFLYGIGLFFEAIGNRTLAGRVFLKHYDKCSLIGCNAELLFRIAMIYKNEGSDAISLRLFNVLMQMHDNPIPWPIIALQIAHIKIHQKDYTKAKSIIKEIFTIDPENIHVHRLNAWMAYEENNMNDEIENILRIGSKKNDPYILYIAGRFLFDTDKLIESFEIYKKAIRRDRNDPWFWNSLGILYAKNKQYEEAKGKFLVSFFLNKNIKETKHNLKIIRKKLKEGSKDAKNVLKFKIEDLENGNNMYSGFDISNLDLSDSEIDSIDFADVNPDPIRSPYFSTHLFLSGKLFRYDGIDCDLYEREIQNILIKSPE